MTFTTLAVTVPTVGSLTSGVDGGAPAGTPGGTFGIQFGGVPGATYRVLGSSDITLALSQWQDLGRATETPAGSGNYLFTDAAATDAARFYILVGQ
jgi:hypothetical protein